MDPDCTCTICEIHGYASYIKAQKRIRELEAERERYIYALKFIGDNSDTLALRKVAQAALRGE